MKLVHASLVIIPLMLVRLNLSVIAVSAGKNVADIGTLGVMLEVSVTVRNCEMYR